MAMFLIWLVAVLQGYAQAQASSTIPFTRIALDLSEGDMSLILALTRLAGIGAIAISWWSDKRGRRRPFLFAYTALMLAGGATALVTNAVQFTALQSGVRLMTAAVSTLAVVLLAERVKSHIRAFAIGLYGAGGSLGAGLGLLALPLADRGPEAWRIPFALTAVGLAVVPFLIRRIDESPVYIAAEPVKIKPLRELLTSRFKRPFWLSAFAATLAASFSSVALAFSTERLVNDIGLSTAKAVAISLIGGTIGGSGFFIGGRLADVIGRRTTTIISLGLMVAGGISVYWLTDPGVLTAAIAVSTFGSFAFVPSAASHRVELFPTGFRSTAGAAGGYMAMIGSALGLLTGRATIDVFGLSETVTALGAAVLAAIVLTALLPETMGQELDAIER